MSMDLEQDCPHCEAKKWELCKKECDANGKKVMALKEALADLGLYLDPSNWRKIKVFAKGEN